jgi:hypothetical protein
LPCQHGRSADIGPSGPSLCGHDITKAIPASSEEVRVTIVCCASQCAPVLNDAIANRNSEAEIGFGTPR